MAAAGLPHAKCFGIFNRRIEEVRRAGYEVVPADDDGKAYFVLMRFGAQNPAYSGKIYILKIESSRGAGIRAEGPQIDYPNGPPMIRFHSPIVHVNVAPKDGGDLPGSICVDVLKDISKWKSDTSILGILAQITLLMEEPGMDSPWDIDAAKAFKRGSEAYSRHVQENYDSKTIPYLRKAAGKFASLRGVCSPEAKKFIFDDITGRMLSARYSSLLERAPDDYKQIDPEEATIDDEYALIDVIAIADDKRKIKEAAEKREKAEKAAAGKKSALGAKLLRKKKKGTAGKK